MVIFGKARTHLPCPAEGTKAVLRDRDQYRDASVSLVAELDTIIATAEEGVRQHGRWLTARICCCAKSPVVALTPACRNGSSW